MRIDAPGGAMTHAHRTVGVETFPIRQMNTA
jgi:hypothetical protein